MKFSNLAQRALRARGETFAFFDASEKVCELSGSFTYSQQLKKSKASRQVIDVPVIKSVADDRVTIGLTVIVNGDRYKVIEKPLKDGYGGMTIKLALIGESPQTTNKYSDWRNGNV